MELELYQIRILISLVMLLVASTLDIWKREVHDILWIGFGAIAVILVFFETDYVSSLTTIAFSLIIAPIALVLWRVGMFGGADAFGLIVLAALVPQITLTGNVITPITTLTNAAIISTVVLAINFIRNLIALLNHKNIFEGFDESNFRKFCAMFLGYRANNPKHSFSIEKIEDNQKKLNFEIHHAENAEFCNTKDTWVTPGIPYMVYITVGFLAQIFFGDIIINLMMSLIR